MMTEDLPVPSEPVAVDSEIAEIEADMKADFQGKNEDKIHFHFFRQSSRWKW